MRDDPPTFHEFFAGGGMARAGLGPAWRCTFANDFDAIKAAAYARNWGDDHLVRGDVAALDATMLPGRADLAWASFPCQDLSLAGDHAGLGRAASLERTRSGTFWPFWTLMQALCREGRGPRLIVLENVLGALSSHGGRDFAAIGEALANAGYRFGACVIDAARFVPQSRPRLFFVAATAAADPPARLMQPAPSADWHPAALVRAWRGLSASARRRWVWWALPPPPVSDVMLSDLVEEQPEDVPWHTVPQTESLLALMSPLNRAKVDAAGGDGRRRIGCVYRRTRPDADGVRRQRAEVRFDGLAGCLRTPAGGSSRQTIMVVEGARVRSRLLSARETARLMGLDDLYLLPARYNDAYHLTGDGVCVPVVRFLADRLLEPLLEGADRTPRAAASSGDGACPPTPRQAAASCGAKRRCTPLPAALEA